MEIPKSAIRNPQSARPLFQRMAIIGVGLIGGSLALAARKAGLVESVVGIDVDPEHRRVALEMGMVDRASGHLGDGLAGADLAVLAVPVTQIVSLLPQTARRVGGACLLTDVGSVKGRIVAAGDAAFPDGRFVAGHPIAGRERSGPTAAQEDLFERANWIATPSLRTQDAALERISELWRGVGSTVVRMDVDWHDEVFATVSHLPHLVAYALMDAVLSMNQGDERLKFAAGGLRDFTRVAASHPAMWTDIFLMNREQVLRVLTAYQGALGRLEAAIREGNGEALTAYLARARIAREEMTHRP
jgi:3-phosphoshikimate 1-carboxyvinyltransferase